MRGILSAIQMNLQILPADGNVVCWTAHHGANKAVGDDYLAGHAVGFDTGTHTNCVLLRTGKTHCWGQGGELLSYGGGDAVQVAVAGNNAS